MLVNQGLTENTDPVTSLRNRTGLMEDLNARIAAEADYVKFDRRLVEGIETSGPDRLTMKYLALLADIRGTQVLAKGVETEGEHTEGEHTVLRDFTVSGMQGNFFSGPLSCNGIIREFLP